jgi:proline iminopeptidase
LFHPILALRYEKKPMSPSPFDQQDLSVGDGHTLYVAQYGQPDGDAAIVLHGGPGSGTQPSVLDWFDLNRQRVVLFDQRGAGRSQPQGGLSGNDTPALVDDIEKIRKQLGIDRWLVVGGSWGATLALLYAGRHAARVSALVLRGSFLASERELQWFFQSLRALVPQGWARLTDGWPDGDKADVLGRLADALLHGDAARATDAARRWNDYENAVMNAMAGQLTVTAGTVTELPARVLNKYRLQAHFLTHACFTSEAELMDCAAALAATPVTLVHGTHDLVCPPENAQLLAQAMPHARLQWVAQGGHTPGDARIANALRDAIAQASQGT